MTVLSLNAKLMQFMGFMHPHLFGPNFSTLFPNFAFSLFSGILLYGSVAYCFEYMHSLNDASEAIYVIAAMAISIAVNLCTVAQKKNIGQFFKDIPAVVDKSVCILNTFRTFL